MLKIYDADRSTRRLIKKVYKATLRFFSQPDIFMVEISVVDEDVIRAVNKEKRNVDSITDVLSFPAVEIGKNLPVRESDYPLDVDPDSGKLLLGETLMCMQKIRAQAIEYGHSEEREAGYLFLHSLLHLFGYDHMTDEDKKEMREKEESILSALKLKI